MVPMDQGAAALEMITTFTRMAGQQTLSSAGNLTADANFPGIGFSASRLRGVTGVKHLPSLRSSHLVMPS